MNTLKTFTLGLFLLSALIPVFAQTNAPSEEYETVYEEPIKLSGPRIGLTAVMGPMAQYMEANGLSPYMSQFGWQFETRYFQTRSGYQGLVEFVPLIAGLESNQSAVSANLLVGFRTPSGFEIGVGPNFAARGLFSYEPLFSTSLVYAVGHTFKLDDVNIPFNLAFSPTSQGARITFLIGFNIKNRTQNMSKPSFR